MDSLIEIENNISILESDMSLIEAKEEIDNIQNLKDSIIEVTKMIKNIG